MATELQSPPDLNSDGFRITEQTQYFYPETWNALIDWQEAWYNYLVAQANFYQQAIAAAADDLRAELQEYVDSIQQTASQAQETIEQTKLAAVSVIDEHATNVHLGFEQAVQQIEAQKAEIAQHAETIQSGLAAINMPTFTQEQAGSLMITNGTDYQVIRPIISPPAF